MSLALIDVGSNTIRLSVYAVGEEAAAIRAAHGVGPEDEGDFIRLISKKVMAGLASYVDDEGALSAEGISRACDALGYLRTIVENFQIAETHVFATASLRNVTNSAEALSQIDARTGLSVELIGSGEEAMLGYAAFQHDCRTERGVLVDIGGGSTEVTTFEANAPRAVTSMPIGSLKLFKRNVEKILPTKKEREKIRKQVERNLDAVGFEKPLRYGLLCGIGGTVRAGAKLVNRRLGRGAFARSFSRAELAELMDFLEKGNGNARELILRTCPDRVHTIVPGLIVLCAVADRFGVEQIKVSQYGVREGYLIEHILADRAVLANAR